MPKTPTLLLVEDDPAMARMTQVLLEKAGYTVHLANNGREGLSLATSGARFDLVLSDFRMPELGGMELLEHLRESNPHLPVVLMTAHGTANLAIEATRKGAFDYLLKPYQSKDLFEVVERAVESSRLTQKRVLIGPQESGQQDSDAIIGNSRAMQQVYKEMGRIADKAEAILIRGEAGTGKKLIARAIWQHSDRSAKPFITVNCATIPETLLESELFGHEKGAFPGASTKRIGRLEQAHQGTLFLDEAGDLAPHTQAKLLLLFQEHSITRLGGTEQIPADVRVIAATNRDLESAIQGQNFREDFFFRLNAAQIHVPPLRERGDDVSLLTGYLLERYSTSLDMPVPQIEETALQKILDYPWPGNVTELGNVIRKVLLRCQGYPISVSMVTGLLSGGFNPTSPSSNGLHVEERMRELLEEAEAEGAERIFAILQEEFERAAYGEAIRFADGNQSKVARLLGISRVTLRDKLDKYQLYPNKRGAKSSQP